MNLVMRVSCNARLVLSSVLLGVGLVAVSPPTVSLADGVIFTTMSETTGQCGSWIVRSNVRYAHQFTAGGAATITSATNQLSSAQKYPSSTKVVIWSNVSNLPGTQLGSLTWQSTSAGNVATYTGSVSLSAGGTYWYEVQPTAAIANHYYCTTASTSQTGSASGWLQLKTLVASGSDSSSWTTFSGTPYQYPMFSLSGTEADTTAPTVSSFSSTTTNGSYKAAAAINITATASEAIQSGNTLTVTLDTGRTVVLTATSAGTSLTGTYTVQAGDTSSDLPVKLVPAEAAVNITVRSVSSVTVSVFPD